MDNPTKWTENDFKGICPLCGGEIDPHTEFGPVGHLMKTHKRTEAEALELLNSPLRSEILPTTIDWNIVRYLTDSTDWYVNEQWAEFVKEYYRQRRERLDQQIKDILNNSFKESGLGVMPKTCVCGHFDRHHSEERNFCMDATNRDLPCPCMEFVDANLRPRS